jgi:hypothetical protein
MLPQLHLINELLYEWYAQWSLKDGHTDTTATVCSPQIFLCKGQGHPKYTLYVNQSFNDHCAYHS